MRNDDANDQRMSLNHSHPFEEADAHDDALLTAEYEPEHEALAALAAKWSATAPSAERIVAFTRQLPSQEPAPQSAQSVPLVERMRSRAQREAIIPPTTRHDDKGRLLATVAAAVLIVGLLATALLRFAPGHTGQQRQKQLPTATATATPLTARQTEEPTNGAATGNWTTVSQSNLIPAPSDGNVVYQIVGSGAQVSHDGGATWHAMTLPAYSLDTQNVSLQVSDADAQVVLLSMTLSTSSPNPSDCPAGSKPPLPINAPALHGGILASGGYYCIANFASHDGGATWATMQLPSGITYPPSAFNAMRIWQLGQTLYGVNEDMEGLTVLHGSSLLISHDLGASWSYDVTTSPEATSELCSFIPSIADGAIYALTDVQDCYGRTQGATDHTIWRSVDAGATWSQVSTISVLDMDFLGASPATDGHGAWLYAQHWDSPTARPTMWFSVDAGATWSQTPPLQQANGAVEQFNILGTLADGSVTLAIVQQTYTTYLSPPAPATFYAWRPGDTAWRQIATTLTAQYASRLISLSRGGAQQAIDTLWVGEITGYEGSHNYYATHQYGIR